jgi:dynein heavy chain
LISNSTIDWFFEWPEEALIDVANYKLAEFNLDEQIKLDVIKFFAYIHISVNDYSKDYLRKLKRVNYTTPKHFLSLILS